MLSILWIKTANAPVAKLDHNRVAVAGIGVFPSFRGQNRLL